MSIKNLLEDWAESTFPPSQSAYRAHIQSLPEAPPLLFTEPTGAGYCVTIKLVTSSCAEAKIQNPTFNIQAPQLGFWIPESGSSGAYVSLRDGDEEISTRSIEWAGEESLRENLSTVFMEFLRDEILQPALEQWLDAKGIAFEGYSLHTASGIDLEDENRWAFVFLPEPTRNQLLATRHSGPSSSVIGLTGDGRAALFSYSRHEVDPRGYVDHIHLEIQATGIDSPIVLAAWLEAAVSPQLSYAAA